MRDNSLKKIWPGSFKEAYRENRTFIKGGNIMKIVSEQHTFKNRKEASIFIEQSEKEGWEVAMVLGKPITIIRKRLLGSHD